MERPRFIVGIDLGTTNTVVARAPIAGGEAPAAIRIQQRSAPGVIDALPALRSCLYAALPGEIVRDRHLPFVEDGAWVVGELAARRGAEVPARLVASAKSWLCHPGVDHREAILPWGVRRAGEKEEEEDGDDDAPAISPVDASRRILEHVRSAWDAEHPGAPLAQQEVVLTVPASFDEVARELTVEAARAAALDVRLLEEPQAAFYAWLAAGGDAALQALLGEQPSARVLVVDVGGGTTDLSLLEIVRDPRADAKVRVARVAVGRHLLLGGDNMDLALAVRAEARLAPGAKLDPARFSQLVAQCRRAKETLLAAGGPARVAIALAPRGAALVGGSLRTEITGDEAVEIVLDGFFPAVTRGERAARARAGLVAFGLPYERDAAISRHVAEFVSRHLAEGTAVDALLLNGGVFRGDRVRERIVAIVSGWQAQPPRVLEGVDPDLGVAIGAVAYGLALRGRGRRIESRSARGWYVAIGAAGEAPRAVCVVPRGADEGARFTARERAFALTLGRPARFDLWSSDIARDRPGDVVAVDEERFERSRPLVARVGAPGEKGDAAVFLEGELTPLGTLDLACVETRGRADAAPRRFRLAFDLRTEAIPAPPSRRAAGKSSVRPSDQRLVEAGEAIEKAFGKASPGEERDAKNLLRELERILGPRAAWPTDLARQLADRLLPLAKQRRRSAEHERAFLLLLGFCLRPGFGFPGDEARAHAAFGLFREKVTFAKDSRSAQQFWILWRRVAGGLDERQQLAIRDELDRFLAPHDPRSRKPKPPRADAEGDLVELLSWLERVPAARRAELGAWLLERTWTDRDPRLWAALGRLGARAPAYASAHHVVAPKTAERWVDHLLRESWTEVPTATRAAWSIARFVGDRARDLSDANREEVARKLAAAGADPVWVQGVRELVERQESERAALFGEDVPPGLRLVEPRDEKEAAPPGG